MSMMRALAITTVAIALLGELSIAVATAQEPPPMVPGDASDPRWQTCVMGDCEKTPTAPAAPVILHFAALAFSPSTLNSGSSHGQDSESAAKDTALKNCSSAGADCQLLNWGSNLCLALAVSRPDGAYGQAPAASRTKAASAALAQCRGPGGGKNCVVQAAPCASDDPRWPAPLPLPASTDGAASVDPAVVGTWELAINPGRWVMEVGAKGTFEFHSEAMDGAPSRAGAFTASNGNWTLNATDGWSDGGSYSFQSPSVWIAIGKLGIGTWHRIASGTN